MRKQSACIKVWDLKNVASFPMQINMMTEHMPMIFLWFCSFNTDYVVIDTPKNVIRYVKYHRWIWIFDDGVVAKVDE